MKHGTKLYVRKLVKANWFDDPVYYYIGYYYRASPVPDITNNRWSGRGHRHMRTTQERRMTYACDEKYIRGKRRRTYLPHNWDDIMHGSYFNKRSWKKNKKRRQWMK